MRFIFIMVLFFITNNNYAMHFEQHSTKLAPVNAYTLMQEMDRFKSVLQHYSREIQQTSPVPGISLQHSPVPGISLQHSPVPSISLECNKPNFSQVLEIKHQAGCVDAKNNHIIYTALQPNLPPAFKKINDTMKNVALLLESNTDTTNKINDYDKIIDNILKIFKNYDFSNCIIKNLVMHTHLLCYTTTDKQLQPLKPLSYTVMADSGILHNVLNMVLNIIGVSNSTPVELFGFSKAINNVDFESLNTEKRRKITMGCIKLIALRYFITNIYQTNARKRVQSNGNYLKNAYDSYKDYFNRLLNGVILDGLTNDALDAKKNSENINKQIAKNRYITKQQIAKLYETEKVVQANRNIEKICRNLGTVLNDTSYNEDPEIAFFITNTISDTVKNFVDGVKFAYTNRASLIENLVILVPRYCNQGILNMYLKLTLYTTMNEQLKEPDSALDLLKGENEERNQQILKVQLFNTNLKQTVKQSNKQILAELKRYTYYKRIYDKNGDVKNEGDKSNIGLDFLDYALPFLKTYGDFLGLYITECTSEYKEDFDFLKDFDFFLTIKPLESSAGLPNPKVNKPSKSSEEVSNLTISEGKGLSNSETVTSLKVLKQGKETVNSRKVPKQGKGTGSNTSPFLQKVLTKSTAETDYSNTNSNTESNTPLVLQKVVTDEISSVSDVPSSDADSRTD